MITRRSNNVRPAPSLVFLVLLLSLSACARNDDSAGMEATSASLISSETRVSAKDLAFCKAFTSQLETEPGSGSSHEEYQAELTELAPGELREVMEILEVGDNNDNLDQVHFDAIRDLMIWADEHCRETTDEPVRQIGPVDAPEGYFSCGNQVLAAIEPDRLPGSIIMYGDGGSEDPFGEPLVAILTGIGIAPTFDPEIKDPVEINGVVAETGPARFFVGDIGPANTFVVTWMLDGNEVTVFARGYIEDEIDELLAIARSVSIVDGQAVADKGTGDILYNGDTQPFSIAVPFFPREERYSLNYQTGQELGMLSLHQLQMSEEAFVASRAFYWQSEPSLVNGLPGFTAHAWSETGPYVAAWREPGGVVMLAVGSGVKEDDVTALAEASVVLDAEQWRTAARIDVRCFDS